MSRLMKGSFVLIVGSVHSQLSSVKLGFSSQAAFFPALTLAQRLR